MRHAEINPLRPGDAYMRRWIESSLVHVMACRLRGAKPLPEPKSAYQLDPNKPPWNLNQNTIFNQENAFQYLVWIISTILFQAFQYCL